MKITKKMIGLVVLSALLIAVPANAKYSAEDVESAGSDVVQLKNIANDGETEEKIRYNAVVKLSREDQKSYLDANWVASSDVISALLSFRIGQYGMLAVDDYARYIPLQIKNSRNGKSIGMFQMYYVTQLIKEGDFDLALSESKRLWGLSQINKNYVNRNLNLIANAIMKKELDNGATIVQAAKAGNDYKQAISEGTQENTAYWQAAYPPVNTDVLALENNDNPVVVLQAYIYNGKWTEAESKAEEVLMLATRRDEVDAAMSFIGQVANGKAGTPTAANEIFQEQE